MTYGNATKVQNLVKIRFTNEAYFYKNIHHVKMTELIIGRNLHWMASCGCPATDETPTEVG